MCIFKWIHLLSGLVDYSCRGWGSAAILCLKCLCDSTGTCLQWLSQCRRMGPAPRSPFSE